MTDRIRRGVLKGAAAAGSLAAMRFASAQQRSDDGPRELDGKAMPEPRPNAAQGPFVPVAVQCCRAKSPL